MDGPGGPDSGELHLIHQVAQGNAQVAFVVHALAVPDHQHLGRLVGHVEQLSHLIGDGAEGEQVEVIKVGLRGQSALLEPLVHDAADGTAGTVLENHLRFYRRFRDNLF